MACGPSPSFPTTPHAQQPQSITCIGFRLFPFRSPLLRESLRFLFLRVLRCFTSPGSLPLRDDWITPDGLPHSEICGSKACLRLPAAYRSLPRPSSAVSAKASTVCPYYLNLHSTDLSNFTYSAVKVLLVRDFLRAKSSPHYILVGQVKERITHHLRPGKTVT